MPTTKLFTLSMIMLCSSFCLNGQEFEVHSGVSFHSISHDNYRYGHDLQEYRGTMGIHYSIGYLSKKKYRLGDFPFRLYLSIHHYGGKWRRRGGSRAGSRLTEIEFQKTLVSLTHYWFKINLVKDIIQINLGPEVSLLIREQAEGMKRIAFPFNYEKEFIDFNSDWISNPVRVAFQLRLTGRIPIKDHISLKPQYILTRGISNEFPGGNVPTRILAHRFDLGLGISM